MLENFLILLAGLLLIAAFSGDSTVFKVVYLLVGALVLGRLWSQRALRGLVLRRSFTPRAFCGEEVPVQLHLSNQGLLPLLWLHVHESLPVEVAPRQAVRHVISLGPRAQATLEYVLRARKRGCYPIGPLSVSTSDLLGLGGDARREGSEAFLTVYPRIIHLTRLELPSHSPLGTLRHKQPVYEDPSRVWGKRDYTPGDSLRRVDWKASAALGRLQVKQFEPSIALTTALFLDLNEEAYATRGRLDALELAVVAAASLANWVVSHKQSVGLVTNGLDMRSDGARFEVLPPRKGRGHLMRILEVLARVQAAETQPLISLLRQEAARLPWGATLVLITGSADEALFDSLFWARQAGLNAALVLVGQVPGLREAEARGRQFGFPVVALRNEADLDIWRG